MDKKRVLIVDDTKFMRYALGKILSLDGGYEIVGEAGNGEEGIQKYVEIRPDIVTLDITMPDMEGIEALEKILEIDKNAKVVMISALGHKENVAKALSLGAKKFIKKPFEKEDILNAFREL